MYEELALKKEIGARVNVTLSQEQFHGSLHINKFDSAVMQQLRLAFLTSKQIMDLGGKQGLGHTDFKTMVHPTNERMCYDFLIDNFEQSLDNLNPQKYRDTLDSETQVQSLLEFNARNIA